MEEAVILFILYHILEQILYRY